MCRAVARRRPINSPAWPAAWPSGRSTGAQFALAGDPESKRTRRAFAAGLTGGHHCATHAHESASPKGAQWRTEPGDSVGTRRLLARRRSGSWMRAPRNRRRYSPRLLGSRDRLVSLTDQSATFSCSRAVIASCRRVIFRSSRHRSNAIIPSSSPNPPTAKTIICVTWNFPLACTSPPLIPRRQ